MEDAAPLEAKAKLKHHATFQESLKTRDAAGAVHLSWRDLTYVITTSPPDAKKQPPWKRKSTTSLYFTMTIKNYLNFLL